MNTRLKHLQIPCAGFTIPVIAVVFPDPSIKKLAIVNKSDAGTETAAPSRQGCKRNVKHDVSVVHAYGFNVANRIRPCRPKTSIWRLTLLSNVGCGNQD